MNEEPKSIWRKPWKGPRGYFLFWLLILVAAFLIVFCVGLLAHIANSNGDMARTALILATVVAVGVVLIVSFFRWLFCWRNFKRFLFDVACCITLVALFYAEEDWRGKHDWAKFKHEREAKGERFDATGVIPPSVPDDQNFAMTPAFDAVDKLMDQKWRAEHLHPQFGSSNGHMQ